MGVVDIEYEYAEYVPAFKAVSDETRLRIIDILSCGELCACKILESFHITQPTLSYHMRILTESGLVVGRRDGAWMHYSLDREKCMALVGFLTLLANEKEDRICKTCQTGTENKT